MIDEDPRLHRIFEKLEQARSRGLECFGSESHRFRLKPPASESELSAFEKEHGVLLPEDYRSFLKVGGNGGAGPYYGIHPISRANDFGTWTEGEPRNDFLRLPCPLHPDFESAPDWEDGLDCESPYQGTLSLGTRGCTYAMRLIVTGPFRGRVVYIEEEGGPPYVVRETDFLSWYERWLDELLGGYDSSSFGYGPGGGEDDFFGILNDALASDGFKSEAAHAFCRLPRLTDAAAARIPAYLSHALSGVRSGACATVRKFRIPAPGESVSRLLDDECPLIRRQAVLAVMNLDPVHWASAVRRRLREDSNDEVSMTAFMELGKCSALSKSDLLDLIEASPLANIRCWAADTVEWERSDLDVLDRMLGDGHAHIRRNAVLGLQQLKDRDCLPKILELLSREKDDLVVDAILEMFKEVYDPTVSAVLLQFATSTDDFHRLAAVEALAAQGDDRAAPIAAEMLREHRPPVRDSPSGDMSNIHNISKLVRKMLKSSPNATLRRLAK